MSLFTSNAGWQKLRKRTNGVPKNLDSDKILKFLLGSKCNTRRQRFLSGISKYAPDKRIEGIFCVRWEPADFCRPDQKGDEKCCQSVLFVKIEESQNYLWDQFMVECPRNNALIKVDSFDLQALCENTRSQNFNHKVASWPRSSTWKQRLLNLSWHWKQITNRVELGTSVWSKNVSSFFGSWSRGTIKPTIMIKGRPQLKKNVFFRALPE